MRALKIENIRKEILTYLIALEPVIAIGLAYLVPWSPEYRLTLQRLAFLSIFWLWPILIIGYLVLLREPSNRSVQLVESSSKIIHEPPELLVINRENMMILYWLIQLIFPYYPLLGVPIQWLIMFYTYIAGFQISRAFIYFYKLRKQDNSSIIIANFKFSMFYTFGLVVLPLLSIYRLYLISFDYPLDLIFILGPGMVFFMMGWNIFYAFYDENNDLVIPRFNSISHSILLFIILYEIKNIGLLNELLYGNSFFPKLIIINFVIIILFNLVTLNKSIFNSYLMWSLDYSNIFIYYLAFIDSVYSSESMILGIIIILLVALMIPNTINLAEKEMSRE